MDLNRKRELLREIAAAAPKLAHKPEEELNLLDLLNSFDRVLSQRHLDPESPAAIDLYKTLLRLGRIKSQPWEARIAEHLDQSASESSGSSQRKPRSRKGSAKDFDFDGSFGHGKEESKDDRGRAKRNLSDASNRAPLMNITNKEERSPTVQNQRYQAEEVHLTPPSNLPMTRTGGVIELPKLQISQLLLHATSVEPVPAGPCHVFTEEERRRSLQMAFCSSIRSDLSMQSVPQAAVRQSEDRIAALTHKLELLKHEPAEKEGEPATEASNELIASSYHVPIDMSAHTFP